MHWLHKLLDKLFRVRGEQEGGDVVKPFLDHLEDLRWTLIKMAMTLAVGMIVAFLFVDDISRLMREPLAAVHTKELGTLGITDAFMISLQIAFYAGLVLTFPLLIYFIAEFVLPALTRQERRLLVPGILGGFLLFGVGVVLAYHYILPLTLRWFHDYAVRMGTPPNWQAKEYFGFVTHLTIACGLLAELPVVVLALAFLNLVSFQLLTATRKYAYVVIMILVAIISPTPDPITFIVMAAPVLAIYEGCIWIVWGLERRRLSAGPGA